MGGGRTIVIARTKDEMIEATVRPTIRPRHQDGTRIPSDKIKIRNDIDKAAWVFRGFFFFFPRFRTPFTHCSQWSGRRSRRTRLPRTGRSAKTFLRENTKKKSPDKI